LHRKLGAPHRAPQSSKAGLCPARGTDLRCAREARKISTGELAGSQQAAAVQHRVCPRRRFRSPSAFGTPRRVTASLPQRPQLRRDRFRRTAAAGRRCRSWLRSDADSRARLRSHSSSRRRLDRLSLRRHLDRPVRCGDHGGRRSDSPKLGRRGRIGMLAAASTPAYAAVRLCGRSRTLQPTTGASANRPPLAIPFVCPPVPKRTSPMPPYGRRPSPEGSPVSPPSERRPALRSVRAIRSGADEGWPPLPFVVVGDRVVAWASGVSPGDLQQAR
jgi:hypothetical protein